MRPCWSSLVLVVLACGPRAQRVTIETSRVPPAASSDPPAEATASAPVASQTWTLGPVIPNPTARTSDDDHVMIDGHPLYLDRVSVSGRLPPETVIRIIHLNRARFRFCYSEGLRKNPKLEGRAVLLFTIDRAGSVANARIDPSSTLSADDVRTCLTDAARNLSFPQPEGGTVDVTYPMSFTATPR